MMCYFIRLLQYVKVVDPCVNEIMLLTELGMTSAQIEKVMEEYKSANFYTQEF